MDTQIEKGFEEARKITEKHAKTFFFASHLLPPDKRLASYAIYAICRLSDDAVDTRADANIPSLRKNISDAYSDKPLNSNILAAFRETVKDYDIPMRYFDELIEGMNMDIENKRYANFDELYVYCYRVAGVVGLMMNKVLGGKGELSEKYAEKLGIAMQLTNILRDIREDHDMGRIYIPQDMLRKYKITEEMIAMRSTSRDFRDLLKYEMARTREYYRESLKGIPLIDDLRSRIVVLTMKEMYEDILRVIEKNGYNVMSKRAYTSSFRKLWILIRVLFGFKYLRSSGDKVGHDT
jgi:15-cis-phytoene synthase